MVVNYLKVAFRNIFRKKSYAYINIGGLSISLAVSLLMLLWVFDEWNTDKFHENVDRIYRVKRTIPLEAGRLDVYRGISYPMLEAAQKEIPEVEKYITLGHPFEDNLQMGETNYRALGTFTNTAFFESFSFPVLQGDISQLDKKIDALAISESLARRIFGNVWETTALGQTIHIHDNGDYSIEAVYADFPANSTIQSEFYYPFQAHLAANDWMLEWTNNGMQGALLLSQGADPAVVSEKLEKMFHAQQEGELKEGCLFQLFADDYLYGQFDEQARVAGGRIEYVRTFAIAALFLLIISCINFVNLATAHASKRAKEVGVRKAVGAGFRSLVTQFMMEAGMITFVSLILAITFGWLLLPQVNDLTGKALYFDFTQLTFIGGLFLIFLVTTLLSGAYPSFVLSSFRPINVLKGGTTIQKGNSFRKALVVMQFGLSLVLIVGALIVRQQVNYIKNKNLGINKENLLTIHQDEKITEKYAVLRNELISQEGIKDVTVAGPSPLNMQASTSGVSWPGKHLEQQNVEFQILWTAGNFLDVFNVPLIAGEFYRKNEIIDTQNIVLNERAIAIMGMEDPVGKSIDWWGKPRQIIGIVKDFHNRSLYEEIEPAAFLLDAENAGYVFVKSEEGKVTQAIEGVRASFQKVLPDVPLHYEFVDEQYQRLYEREKLTGSLANYFAIISIFISCLGLLGLATFAAERRIKEIGIRKVLGASTGSLVSMLSRDFIKLVVLAFVIASPLAYFFMKKWLQDFAYRIDIHWWVFALAGVLALMVAFLTVGYKSFKAAIANPIQSLRNE